MFGKKKLLKRIEELESRHELTRILANALTDDLESLKNSRSRTSVCTRCGKRDFVDNMVKKEEAVLEYECNWVDGILGRYCTAENDSTPGKVTGSRVETTWSHKSCRNKVK